MINKMLTTLENKFCTPKKKIICMDFDGVIHSYKSGWKGARTIPDEPVNGAIKFLYDMAYEDATGISEYKIAIYSARSRYIGGRKAIKRWLIEQFRKKYGDFPLPFKYCDEIIYHFMFPTKKPPAYITIDDRCICFNGEYEGLLDDINGFKTWYGTNKI